MASTHSSIRPNTYLFLRLPNEMLRLIEIKVNTIIEVGKLGSFPANLLLGRPYHHTYEILEKREGEAYSRLRIVPQAELNTEAGLDDATPAESRAEPEPGTPNGASSSLPNGYELLGEDGSILTKNNRLTIDDATRQTLSHAEIEELKKSAGSKEVIEKILASHTGLDEKTVFSKAKYMLRKHKKYLKRFTALPMDFGGLIDYITEKEPPRIMDLRQESLGLITAWSHAHYSGIDGLPAGTDNGQAYGRWLVAEDTGGLVVAALAERMGILHASPDEKNGTQPVALPSEAGAESIENVEESAAATAPTKTQPLHRDYPPPATSNTITLVHPAVQPNVSTLKYFGYDTSNPTGSADQVEHPLHTHFKSLSWLQLLQPQEDPLYTEPERVSEDVLASWKSGKRGTYFKKRRRWDRCRSIVDETRLGEFDGLVIASPMDPVSILEHTVPLIRGGGHLVMYSPTIEPLVRVIDLYSKERRAAYIAHISKDELPDAEDFPVDPRLLLAPSIQTSRVRDWQVLPGRTHPLMTSRGGAEGYVLIARKVVPLAGVVDARGNFYGKKRKVAQTEDASSGAAAAAPAQGVSAAPVDALVEAAEAAPTPA
ncbi:Putative tRNA (adenine(58)-N(1))-methyltransferase non-catalytic subunit TRM6 [Septoria linicola]|uniref:tRNA (adenine(58)-N(1))-methyltransferase non-catalytic subunit TRM6 n=1 Tax=Septoria linicola TaxID=215465 RepID=A0A9Q9EII1_9PEZI|nr:putative tRNA (adenine(58)-N(1))-methyltransferase non-catalytic subunit TRM6 [Septoria linicola]USW51119.1 Putative tRNA (adenine(58)-N(1))-methyltransferase non-catalytic subunit TRM6 [Septoria linicola]